jgi:NADPH:quinone reductase-like Zn-dependent oxidoreductase
MALSSLLLSSSSPDPAFAYVDFDDARKKKRILITGSNSGIGLDAAQRMVLRGHEVVLACVSDSMGRRLFRHWFSY